MSQVGVAETLDMAKRMGITTFKGPSDYGLSLVLGTGTVMPLQMTNVFAAFANKGQQYEPTSIASITDKSGRVIYSHIPTPRKVLDEGVAFQISSVLSDTISRSEVFSNALTISRTAAVKTGTTEDYRDAWTIGYTPSVVVGVWVGNNDNTSMDKIAGSLGAAPIWKSIIERYLEGTPIEKFEIPSTISTQFICRQNGYLLRNQNATSSAIPEYFLSGTGPTRMCNGGSAPAVSGQISATVTPGIAATTTPESSTPTTLVETPTSIPTITTPTSVSTPTSIQILPSQ
jgi:membrane peptidoglycan carboxypeptidase